MQSCILVSVIVMNDNRHPEVNVTPLILMLETLNSVHKDIFSLAWSTEICINNETKKSYIIKQPCVKASH